MPTYVWRKGKIIDRDKAPPLIQQFGVAPFVISDTMQSTRHMADGRYYSSKAAFRAATKAAGCIEVGNETSTLLKPRKPAKLDRAKRRDDIRRTISELRNGRR